LQSKVLDFKPFLTDLIPRAFDLTLDARKRIAQMTEEGELTYIKATHEAFSASLPPGPALSSICWNSRVFPSIIAPDGYKGRATIQAALIKYFEAGHDGDPDVSKLIRTRSDMHRSFGFQLDDFAKTELSIP
jgi:hypothetical protein